MKGKIFLIQKGIGKIIFDNGKESETLSLPESFSNGDIVEFEYRNGQFFNLVAYSEEFYYGQVFQEFSKTKGIILARYPEILGTILYDGVSLKRWSYVKFRLKKSKKGVEAIDISDTDEIFKCKEPILVTNQNLKKEVLEVKNGVVTHFVKEEKLKNIKGRIKVVKDRGFGFISSEIGDVFFVTSMYKNFFKKEPIKGEEIFFSYKQSNRGLQVDKFAKQNLIKLPKKEWYIKIDDKYKIKYENYPNRDVEVGDIVTFVEDDGDIIFRDKNLERYVIKFSNKKFVEGKIFKLNKGFGFIKSSLGNLFFLFKQFQNFYNEEPEIGKKVRFEYEENDKGLRVKKFVENRIFVKTSDFKNFVEIDDSLYFVYQDGKSVEIYRYDENDLNQSITIYNSKNVDDRFKIRAIEVILENGYESKKIKKEKLFKEYKTLLEKHSDIKEFAIKLQKIDFDLEKYYVEGSKEMEVLDNFMLKSVVTDEDKVDVFEEFELKNIDTSNFINIIEDVK